MASAWLLQEVQEDKKRAERRDEELKRKRRTTVAISLRVRVSQLSVSVHLSFFFFFSSHPLSLSGGVLEAAS